MAVKRRRGTRGRLPAPLLGLIALVFCAGFAMAPGRGRVAGAGAARGGRGVRGVSTVQNKRRADRRGGETGAAHVAARQRSWRGTKIDEEGVRLEGWFNEAGELHGRGTMHFPDGSWQSCRWDS